MSSFLGSIFGTKPNVPNLPALNLGTEQQTAISNNQAALPGAENLVSQSNLFSQQQIDQMLQRVIPNYDTIRGNISRNIGSMTRGEIPTDVSNAVQNNAAARALGGGFAGSQAHGALVARDLGLTSLDLTQRGISAAENWMRTASSLYQPSMLNLSSMFVTPGQQAAFDVNERDIQFQRNWMQSQINAMPDPVMAGINAEVMSLASSFLGGHSGMGDYTQNYSGVKPSGGYGGSMSGFEGVGLGNDYGGEMSAPDGMSGDFGANFGGGAMGFV